MKIIVIICMIVAHCLATKEKITDDDIYSMLNDQEILKEIVKRLEGNDLISSPQKKSHPPIPENSNLANNPSDSGQCRTHAFEGKIIRTDDSLKAGAVYLDSIQNVESNEACFHRCCSSSKGCDLAVYENKTKHNCFLFQCRNKTTGQNMCLFDKLDAYISTTVSVIPDNGQTSSSGTIPDLKHDLGTNSESSEQKQPVPVETTPRPTQLPHSVALGKTCSSDLSCEDPHAECVETQCQCRQNFYRRNRVCREVCGNNQMECMSRGTSRRGPDCIPKSQVCDGTTQCADGSDERDCLPDYPNGDRHGPGFDLPQPPVSDNTQDQGVSGSDSSLTDNPELPNEDKDQPSSQTDVKDSSKELSKPPVDKNEPVKQPEVPHNQIPEEKSTTSSQIPQEKLEKQTEPPKHTNSENSLKPHTNTLKTTAPTQPAEKSEVPVKKTGDHHDAYVVKETKGEGFITKKKVYVATDGAQGPIVALSLGLAFTLMLLVFVGCRLRNVRRRLRKGRPLHSNEADYLINGMYL